MDEAWSMFTENMGEFMESMFRTIRKKNGSITIISQGVEELVRAAVGSTVITNAATQIILYHPDEQQVADLGEVFGFTDHELDKIRSIRKLSGSREVFIKQADYGKVYLLEVADEIRLLVSSKPDERNELNRLIAAKGGRIRPAIQQYFENHPNQRTNGNH